MKCKVPSLLFIFGGAVAGCQAPFVDSPSLISELTVLAIQAEPPEGKPGSKVAFRALVVTGEGQVSDAFIDWDLCKRARDVAENNSVAPECLSGDQADLVPVGEFPGNEAVHTEILSEACALFGSEPAPAAPGESLTRPADPDSTQGYYAPIRAKLVESMNSSSEPSAQGLSAVGQVRVRCALPSAPVDIARDYAARYSNNQNPALEALRLTDDQGTERISFAPGEKLQLQASWQLASVEEFVMYDSLSQTLLNTTEELKVAWFATAGTMDTDRSTAEAGATEVRVIWTAPSERTEVQFWAVLRDNRGGVSWKRYSVPSK